MYQRDVEDIKYLLSDSDKRCNTDQELVDRTTSFVGTQYESSSCEVIDESLLEMAQKEYESILRSFAGNQWIVLKKILIKHTDKALSYY